MILCKVTIKTDSLEVDAYGYYESTIDAIIANLPVNTNESIKVKAEACYE